MIRRIVPTMFIVLLGCQNPQQSERDMLYRYQDDHGIIHLSNTLSGVPPQYVSRVERVDKSSFAATVDGKDYEMIEFGPIDRIKKMLGFEVKQRRYAIERENANGQDTQKPNVLDQSERPRVLREQVHNEDADNLGQSDEGDWFKRSGDSRFQRDGDSRFGD